MCLQTWHKMATGEGDYSYNSVDNPPDDTVCHICSLVARDPQHVTCCCKIFCKTCLDTEGQGFVCPICGSSLRMKYFKDGRTEQGIKSLNVYCTNTDSGCQWMGNINDIDTHLNSCPYQLVPCTSGCGEKIRRSTLETHLTDNCTKRVVNCHYCDQKGQYQLTTSRSHLDVCPDLPIQCSNEGCNEKIPRHSLASHNETCPKAIIPCEYNTVGCNKRMKREEQERHNEEALKQHLEATAKKINGAMKKIGVLLSTNQVIKLNQFTEKKQEREDWCSPGFYSSPVGYKMSLNVIANGHGDVKGTHVSCFICLMAGEYDDMLEWPFQGEVTVELLNQLEDKNHKKITIRYNDLTEDACKQRVQSQDRTAKGWGRRQFISHEELEHNPAANCQYLKDDSLYFRVNVKAQV